MALLRIFPYLSVFLCVLCALCGEYLRYKPAGRARPPGRRHVRLSVRSCSRCQRVSVWRRVACWAPTSSSTTSKRPGEPVPGAVAASSVVCEPARAGCGPAAGMVAPRPRPNVSPTVAREVGWTSGGRGWWTRGLGALRGLDGWRAMGIPPVRVISTQRTRRWSREDAENWERRACRFLRWQQAGETPAVHARCAKTRDGATLHHASDSTLPLEERERKGERRRKVAGRELLLRGV